LEALKQVFLEEDFGKTRPYRQTVEEEVVDQIEEARKQGPTLRQSFHESMTRRGGCLHAIMSDVVAYANTEGGSIYVGLTANQRVKPKGVENPSQAIKMLQEEIERMITPPIEVKMDTMTSQESQIIRIAVPRGDDKPYVMEGSKIYIRHESETSLAMRDEIVDLVKRVVVSEVAQPESRRERVAEPARERAPQASRERQASQPRQRQPQAPAPVAEAQSKPQDDERSNGDLSVKPPSTGVEIDETVVRKGVQYHTMRDLRDGGKVHNVTRSSARRLWRYAIALKEKETFSEDKVDWKGDLGLWHKYLRSGRPHYDLVQRTQDGDIRVYYGVSDDGIYGPWQEVVGKQG
jgi:hypothetical protein